MIGRVCCALLTATLLSGCAADISWSRRQGLNYFVGKSAQSLVDALGQPTLQRHGTGADYIVYAYEGKHWVSGEPGVRTPDTEVAFGPWVDTAKCTTTFKVQAGSVVAWSLDGDECRGAPFPAIRQFAATRIAAAADHDVPSETQFPDDSFTGRSSVAYGDFYSK